MLERIAGIIREQLNLDNVEITEETSFKDDLDADSLDLFELVMAFEEAYNVEIPSEDLEKLETVGDVMDYIRDKEIDAQFTIEIMNRENGLFCRKTGSPF